MVLLKPKKFEEEVGYKEEVQEAREESAVKHVLKWIIHNYKFLLVPGSRLEDLTQRQLTYEKQVSKRKFLSQLKSPLTLLGIIIILCMVTIAVFCDWIAPYPFKVANGINTNAYSPPTPEHLLGTTMLGRDVLSRMIFGTVTSLTLALPAVVIGVVLGVSLGIIAAYYEGWIDSLIMRLVDIFLAFPGLILVMVLISIWGQRLEIIITVWGLLGIPIYSRLIRGSVLQAKNLPYIQSAKISGAGNFRIMFRHILPNCIQPIIIAFSFEMGATVLNLAALAFLGFYDPNLIEWGHDISLGRYYLYSAPWISIGPGIMILIFVLGFMLLGDGLRDVLDPKMKNL